MCEEIDRSDHDLLICIDVKLGELKKQFDNHLRHHWAITVCALGAAISALISVMIILLQG